MPFLLIFLILDSHGQRLMGLCLTSSLPDGLMALASSWYVVLKGIKGKYLGKLYVEETGAARKWVCASLYAGEEKIIVYAPTYHLMF